MTDDCEKLNRATELIDRASSEDPARAIFQGTEFPVGLLYGERMAHWLSQIDPNASEPLQLAVRCQHLRRWMIPRSNYPMTRAGYHQWRTTLARFHAEQAGEILQSAGYDPPLICGKYAASPFCWKLFAGTVTFAVPNTAPDWL